MTEYEQYLKDFKKLTNNLLKSEKKITKFFYDMGLHDEDGNLTENYGGSGKNKEDRNE